MKYCKKCLQPDTRPGVYFNEEGVCGACLWEEEKKHIDWKAREKELQDIADNAKCRAKGAYDCVVGVSGGKDSTLQAFYARDVLKLRPLLVSYDNFGITDLARANFNNLKKHGFEVMSITPSLNTAKKISKHCFYKYLYIGKALENFLYACTYVIANQFNIPLIIQGENGALALGASVGLQDKGGNCLNVVKGNTFKEDPFVAYLTDDISLSDLFFAKVPLQELEDKEITGVWLNYYFKEWSQNYNALFAINKGMQLYPEDISPFRIGGYRRYMHIGMSPMGFCDSYFKYIKFGFGITTEQVCYDIRDGLITRDEGKYILRELDGCYYNQDIIDMCNFLEISQKEFWDTAEKFRGDMFYKNKQGYWRLKDPIWEQEPIEGDYRLSEIMRRLEI